VAARVASIASLLTLSVSLKHLMLITSFFTVKKKIKRDYFNRWHSHGRNDDFIHRSLERLNYNFELSRFLLFVVYYWGERENRLFCYVSDFFFRVALFINTT
jgi:hypothetical protein